MEQPARSERPGIEAVVVPRTTDLGDGFTVRRALAVGAAPDGRPVRVLRPDGARRCCAPAAVSTCVRIRTSGSPP
jgi:hypothetical protein